MAAAPTDARARLEIEPRHQRGIGGGAVRTVALREQRGERLRRIERDLAVERIGGIDGLHLDERTASVISAFTRVLRALSARAVARDRGERQRPRSAELAFLRAGLA